MIDQTTINVFVYGTLLRGMIRSAVLAGGRFLGHGRLDGILYDLGSYPGLTQGAGFVYGELYTIDQNKLNELDRIEGYFPENTSSSLYERRRVVVRLFNDGSTVKAYSYFYLHDLKEALQIACGDYRRERLEQLTPQWYIAYGSNMNSARLRKRLGPDCIKAVETGYLEGYELRFNKKADNGGVYANLAYRGSGYQCPFAAYLISKNDIDRLDQYEGEPRHYIRLGLPFPRHDASVGFGHVYIADVDKLTPDRKPDPSYLQHLRRGYEEHGFDSSTLQAYS